MNEHNLRSARTLSALDIIAIVIILLLLASTAYLFHTNLALRQQLAGRAHPQTTQKHNEPEANAPKAETDEDHQGRLKEHLELLSLRGRVAQLTRELRERTNLATASAASLSDPAQSETNDSILFTASTTNNIPPDHVLIIGGWHNQRLRAYFAFNPSVLSTAEASDSDRLALNAIMLHPKASGHKSAGPMQRATRAEVRLLECLLPNSLMTCFRLLRAQKAPKFQMNPLPRQVTASASVFHGLPSTIRSPAP